LAPIAYHLVRLALGAVFLWASWEKILDPAGFARIVGNYRILPAPLVNPAALILPWVEALCGLALVTGVFTRGALVLFNALVAVFTVALALAAVRGIDIECGCFSVAAGQKGGTLDYLLRDLVLLGAGLWALWYRLARPGGRIKGIQ
jgi:uncharacterized membrane protein YphA (DoxX/SURF4 family)